MVLAIYRCDLARRRPPGSKIEQTSFETMVRMNMLDRFIDRSSQRQQDNTMQLLARLDTWILKWKSS